MQALTACGIETSDMIRRREALNVLHAGSYRLRYWNLTIHKSNTLNPWRCMQALTACGIETSDMIRRREALNVLHAGSYRLRYWNYVPSEQFKEFEKLHAGSYRLRYWNTKDNPVDVSLDCCMQALTACGIETGLLQIPASFFLQLHAGSYRLRYWNK